MKSKRIFISDVHLGVGLASDWFQTAKHEPHLLTMLKWIENSADEVKDLVLLGDLVDRWMCPIDQVPPTTAEIWQHQVKFVAAIQNCLRAGVNVMYVNGNHDMDLSAADLAPLSVDVDGGTRRVEWIQQYNGGLLYAEHGSRFAMFNAPDRMHDPASGFPIGYFITRILAGDDGYTRPGSIVRFVDDLLEAAFTTQTIASSVLEALMEHRGLTAATLVKMPDGRPDVALGVVKERYANLFDRWVEKFGHRYALQAVMGDMGNLGWFADRLCVKEGYRVVVLGHTHDSKYDVDRVLVKNGPRIYVNSGYWCPNHDDAPTFVEVDKLSDRYDVRLKKVKANGTTEDVEFESIS